MNSSPDVNIEEKNTAVNGLVTRNASMVNFSFSVFQSQNDKCHLLRFRDDENVNLQM